MTGERALITGITGFVGSHLAEYLLAKNIAVYGTRRWRSKTENIDSILDRIKLLEADMRDGHSMLEVVREVKPDYIFHLASQSFVPMSWRAPADTIETNVIGTVHLLEAVRQSNIDPWILVAGSSEEYGLVRADELPIKETNELRPLSPYGVSKVAQDRLSIQYSYSYGMKIVVTRAFNHTGPRRGEVFVTSNFAKQIAVLEKKSGKKVIYVGNLDAERDFSDVRDIVKAYWLAVTKCEKGEVYNICSGIARKIKSVLDLLIELAAVDDIEVVQDPTRMRPSDVEKLQGDCTKFRKQTGWEPEIDFRQTMKDLLDYWRSKV